MISTGTLGEKKANVKSDFCFALLSPHAFSDASGSDIQAFYGLPSLALYLCDCRGGRGLLGGLCLLLCFSVALLGLLLVKLPSTAPELPPSVRTLAIGAQGFLICLSLFGMATGIGLIYLRNWARISVLIWRGFSVFFGLIGIPIAFFTQFPPNPSSPALPAESMQVLREPMLPHDDAPIRALSEVSDRVDAPFSIRHIALQGALRPPGTCRCDIL